MDAKQISDLKVGDWALFDAIFGAEQILEVSVHPLGQTGLECMHLHVCDPTAPPGPGRFVVRCSHEPVLRTWDAPSPAPPAKVKTKGGR